MWYSGPAAHRRLGLTEAHVNWIATQVYSVRQRADKEIRAVLV